MASHIPNAVLQNHKVYYTTLNPLSANPEKWPNTLKQFVANLPTNCLSVLDHFMNLALKGLSALTKLFRSLLVQKTQSNLISFIPLVYTTF